MKRLILLLLISAACFGQATEHWIEKETPAAGVAQRVWDGSTIAIAGSAFTDTFKGLLDAGAPENSVHLYLIEAVPAGGRIRPGA